MGKAEGALKDLIEKKNAVAIDGKGEAAFYGPKIDFLGKDSLGREHQVGTIQIDFVQPKTSVSRLQMKKVRKKMSS